MTIKERNERIAELEKREFMMMMIDRTTLEDRRIIEEIERELKELKAMA